MEKTAINVCLPELVFLALRVPWGRLGWVGQVKAMAALWASIRSGSFFFFFWPLIDTEQRSEKDRMDDGLIKMKFVLRTRLSMPISISIPLYTSLVCISNTLLVTWFYLSQFLLPLVNKILRWGLYCTVHTSFLTNNPIWSFFQYRPTSSLAMQSLPMVADIHAINQKKCPLITTPARAPRWKNSFLPI